MENLKVRGTRVKSHNSDVRHCERCGREVRRWNRRADGLTLCGSCNSDKWWIAKVTGEA